MSRTTSEGRHPAPARLRPAGYRAHTALDDRGAAAVEFALVLPFLLVIVLGIVDFGRMLNMQITLTQAAREGVRVAALGGTQSEAETRARDALYPVTGANPVLTLACPATVTPTSDAEITITRPFDYITPINGLLAYMNHSALSSPVITARGRMRCNG